MTEENHQNIPFKAETRQLLQILIHSLYAEREVFLRELISNASDALTRLEFLMLTEKNILEPEAEPNIRIKLDKEKRTLTISDNGIGMSRTEIVDNLGTIAHSGVKQFLSAVQESNSSLPDIIGQFGVGFYSAFMVADHIDVHSHGFSPEHQAVLWQSDGNETYTLGDSDKANRGTDIILHLNDTADEFLEEQRIRTIIKKHSDFIPFPIFLNDGEEPVNRRTALWRQSPMSTEDKEYEDFYRQYTLDFYEPITHLHMVIDAPVQLYALLYLPEHPERQMFSPRQQEGLELYARKVLIQEYNVDLLPRAFRFLQGVVDSEDIPLNVSRETIQSSRVMRQIQKLLSGRLVSHLQGMAEKEPEKFKKVWQTYGNFIKEGVATDEDNHEQLQSLLSFRSLHHPDDFLQLSTYIAEMKEGQEKIYYLLGDDEHSIKNSPHLELIEADGFDVLFMTDDIDPFVLLRLKEFEGKPLVNIANEGRENQPDNDGEKKDEARETDQVNPLVDFIRDVLADKVIDVKVTTRLTRSPARLVDPEGSMTQEMQRVYEMLDREYERTGKILEINPGHPLMKKLSEQDRNDPLAHMIIRQVYEDCLLQEGLHPDPVSMIDRIQKIMEALMDK
ncbi:MAG: molecular chaperone HtpG [Anaerolineae bacterium]|nr:molecular chaperone HtpG [Anaerolineae bacterium]